MNDVFYWWIDFAHVIALSMWGIFGLVVSHIIYQVFKHHFKCSKCRKESLGD